MFGYLAKLFVWKPEQSWEKDTLKMSVNLSLLFHYNIKMSIPSDVKGYNGLMYTTMYHHEWKKLFPLDSDSPEMAKFIILFYCYDLAQMYSYFFVVSNHADL